MTFLYMTLKCCQYAQNTNAIHDVSCPWPLKWCQCAQNQSVVLFEETRSDRFPKLHPPPPTTLFVKLTEDSKVLDN
jgi:hypothetical protein